MKTSGGGGGGGGGDAGFRWQNSRHSIELNADGPAVGQKTWLGQEACYILAGYMSS
jgi:hypothetical protein